jgi:hypothetical protein
LFTKVITLVCWSSVAWPLRTDTTRGHKIPRYGKIQFVLS